MRALTLEAPGNLQVRDLNNPIPGRGEILLRVGACGVCGTDRHIVRGEYRAELPVILGHEFAGSVVAAGAEAAVEQGTCVAVDPNIACGRCPFCRRGDVCLCSHRVALGVDLNGGLAEYVLVPATQVYPVPNHLLMTHAALCEPLACCLHGLDLARIQPGMNVAVLGGGVIGQLMVQLARLAGATAVILITRQAGRRRLAESVGATATVDPQRVEVVEAVAGPDGIAPGGVDVVLECVGAAGMFEQAVALAARGGTILIFGVAPQEVRATVSPFDIFSRELRIVGSYLNPLTHGRAVDLVASGRLILDPLITDRLTLDDIPAILRSPPQPGEVKAMMVL